MINQLFTASDIAQLLSVTIRTVYRMIKDGRLPGPSVRIGKKLVRWRKEDVSKFIEERFVSKPFEGEM